jgi:hypothetical protein
MIVALVVPALGWAQQGVHENAAAARDGVVDIENLAGTVEVVGWEREEVEVSGTLGRGTERLDFDADGRRTSIRVVVPERSHDVHGSDLKIMVPVASRVDVETVSADIVAEKLEGQLQLESVSGRIRVASRPAGLEAATVSGSIEVAHAPPRAEIGSVSGGIEIHDASGPLEVGTVSSEVTITAQQLDAVEVETVSGSLRLEVKGVGRGPFDLETVSGTVTMVVPATIAADFELSTFSGQIRNQIGPEPERTSRYAPGEEAMFSTGGGGPRVTISSFSGTVELVTK